MLIKTVDGKLMQIRPDGGSTSVPWESWCAGMDGLGPIVMIAAAML